MSSANPMSLNEWISILVGFMQSLVETYGYAGVFLALLIANATILFPLPGAFIIVLAGAKLNPALVALVGGLGAAIGELSGYAVGRGGGRMISRRFELEKGRLVFRRFGLWSIYLLASSPIPFDIIGLLSGVLKLNPLMFFGLTFAGKATAYVLYAYTGKEVFELLSDIAAGKFEVTGLTVLVLLLIAILANLLYWTYVVYGGGAKGLRALLRSLRKSSGSRERRPARAKGA